MHKLHALIFTMKSHHQIILMAIIIYTLFNGAVNVVATDVDKALRLQQITFHLQRFSSFSYLYLPIFIPFHFQNTKNTSSSKLSPNHLTNSGVSLASPIISSLNSQHLVS